MNGMNHDISIRIDGHSVPARPGESVLDVARRAGAHVPTLCHDPRLEPAAVCRSCLVEIEGQARLQPACSFQASPGLVVRTDSPRVRKHRQVLASLYMADHRLADGLPQRSPAGSSLRGFAKAAGPLIQLHPVHSPRAGRPGDHNPYIGFDPGLCILCARCTRYCDQVHGAGAIALAERGRATTVSTNGGAGLLHSSCELCGGCVDTCPTGAMFDKKPSHHLPGQLRRVRTTCGFCGVGCQLDLNVKGGRVIKVTAPAPGQTINDGNLCVKGRFAYDFIHHQDRLTQPMLRDGDGRLRPSTWPRALERVATGLKRVQERWGSGALGFVSSSRCTSEENYLLQKLARAVFGTNNCHQCAAT